METAFRIQQFVYFTRRSMVMDFRYWSIIDYINSWMDLRASCNWWAPHCGNAGAFVWVLISPPCVETATICRLWSYCILLCSKQNSQCAFHHGIYLWQTENDITWPFIVDLPMKNGGIFYHRVPKWPCVVRFFSICSPPGMDSWSVSPWKISPVFLWVKHM